MHIGTRPFFWTFIIIGLLHLTAVMGGESMLMLRWISKPFIMLLLIYGWLVHPAHTWGRASRYFSIAQVFSLAGDLLLIDDREIFFLSGIGAFLIAQVSYTLAFRRQIGGGLRRWPLGGLSLFAYGASLLGILWPHLGSFKAPVALYALAITGMGLAAIDRHGRVSRNSYLQVLTGALLFILSDSLIALNKFSQPLPHASLWIMGTYIAAQYLIGCGYVRSLMEE